MIRVIALAVFISTFLYSAGAQTAPASPGGVSLPDGPGKAILQRACISCHSASLITSKHASRDDWSQTIDTMMSRGADLSDDEVDTLLDYLASHFGPAGAGAATPSSPPAKAAPPASADASHPPASADATASVNVNKAGVQELESSLGLSETEAKAITQYREQHGNFKTWQDVSSVPGVPREKIENNQKRITF
jgi:competence ComEA-like helix-hairpin-helix protein